jgi:hypothetical protein
MRPNPSAAPLQTPSKSDKTGRMVLFLSSASIIANSVVPGFVKQTSMPEALAVDINT